MKHISLDTMSCDEVMTNLDHGISIVLYGYNQDPILVTPNSSTHDLLKAQQIHMFSLKLKAKVYKEEQL